MKAKNEFNRSSMKTKNKFDNQSMNRAKVYPLNEKQS